MAEPSCPGCRERDALIAELFRRVADLEARLGLNSTNSSIPPSANPPGAPPPVVKKPTGRKRGGQAGHQAHLRRRLPAARLTQPTRHYFPDTCVGCHDDLPMKPGPDDPEPRWHQVVELPATQVEVTEHLAHG